MKLLIIDDHSIMRAGLTALLQNADPQIEVLQAGGTSEGVAAIEAHLDFDAVFLDINMPGESGMSALGKIAALRPDLPVILLSSSEDPADVRRGLAAGALGYLPKSSGLQTLMSALRLVLSGEVYVPPLMLQDAAPHVPAQMEPPRRGETGIPLTDRQIEVLRLVVDGLSNKEIGRMLTVSERTVKAHITAIFKALGVINRTQAAEAARRASLI